MFTARSTAISSGSTVESALSLRANSCMEPFRNVTYSAPKSDTCLNHPQSGDTKVQQWSGSSVGNKYV